MYRASVAGEHDFESWRESARALILAGIPPQDIDWRVGDTSASPLPPALPDSRISVPRQYFDLARLAIQHEDPNRFALLYALLFIVAQDRSVLGDADDPLIARIEAMAREASIANTQRIRTESNNEAALAALREDANHCTRCDLYRHATQPVFSEGPADAALMLVGEQPGDQEDLQGRPFVGPAGQLLDKALEKAGIDRLKIYVSNAVKHFKFEPRGKRRIHSKPNAGEITACRWWIDQERALIKPRVIVALGATASQSLLGKPVTISRTRGTPIPLPDGSECHVTIHPSYLLRIDDDARAKEEYQLFVRDLAAAQKSAIS
jgi:uracil-DNA glycosylase family protein